MVSAPSSAANWANTPLQELAKAPPISMVPWAEGQVMVSPPTTVEPVQVKVRPKQAGQILNGRRQGDRLEHRAGGEGAGQEAVHVHALVPLVPLLDVRGSAGSKVGVDTMHRISPVS